MENPLPPSLMAALSTVANISDRLAETLCHFSRLDMDSDTVLTNLDQVASALTFEEMQEAPAMLHEAARAFRRCFPSDSLGWDDAATLAHIAGLIENELGTVEQIRQWNERIEARNLAGLNVPPALPIVYKAWPDAPPRLTRLNSL